MDHYLLESPHLPRSFHGHETYTPLSVPTHPSQGIYRLYFLFLLSPSQLPQIETPLSPSQNPHQSHHPPNISSPPPPPSPNSKKPHSNPQEHHYPPPSLFPHFPPPSSPDPLK